VTRLRSIVNASETSAAGALYDGRSAESLAVLLSLPRVIIFDDVPSTLDVAHDLGEKGAEAGTLILADAQSAGRGRMGRVWRSDPGAGIWLTLLERPAGDESLGVLALRLALGLAPALDAFSVDSVALKWPNDLYVAGRKLAGILIEARWHGPRLDWLAVGAGINMRVPDGLEVAGLADGTDRVSVLRAIIPALRTAVATRGLLTREELRRYALRDFAARRRCTSPAEGIVAGIDAAGSLLVDTAQGRTASRAGSLILAPTDTHSLGDSA